MQGLLMIALAAFLAVWAWRTDDKPVRWFLIGACLFNLLAVRRDTRRLRLSRSPAVL